MATEEIGIRLSVKQRREAAKALRDTADDVGKIDRNLDKVSSSGRRAETALDRAARAGGRFGTNVAKGVAIGAAALVGIGYGAGRLAVGFIKDAQESAKIGRLTDAAIKSTGGVANVTADQIGKLAETLSNKTAIDDEAIQSGMNMLLSFSQVRDEVGKGNDIFTQASALALDYSVRTGVDAVAANVALGKALNNPIKGLAALGKAGVSFSDQQAKQIKTMMKAGDILGAQKVILAAVGENFAGSAEAAADPLDRLRVIAGNMGERIGGVLLPHVERFATFLTLTAVPVFERFMDQFDRGIGTGGRFRDKIVELKDAGVQLWEEFRTGVGTGGELRDALELAGAAAMVLGTAAHDYILPAMKWFNDHPDALKGIVAGMVAYKIAAEAAAIATTAIATAGLFGLGGDGDDGKRKSKGGKGKGGGGPSFIPAAGRFARPAVAYAAVDSVRRATDTPWHDVFGLTEQEKAMVGRVAPPSDLHFPSPTAPAPFPNLLPPPRQPLVVQSVLDGRVIAETVVDDIHSREARR